VGDPSFRVRKFILEDSNGVLNGAGRNRPRDLDQKIAGGSLETSVEVAGTNQRHSTGEGGREIEEARDAGGVLSPSRDKT